ncbi:DMT family transporter [Blastomonas sp.]|uniref:DMT family transporter n=1 Tax=Blastomonas sp. TaxID=1909299 RepID=UPI00359417EE
MIRPCTAQLGILLMVTAMFCISLNDMVVKSLAGSYPLHQIVFARTGLGILFSIIFLQLEGGFPLLRTTQVGLHIFRALLVVLGNSLFYAAIVAMPLATANALYFVAPLFVTLLSIPVLGERIGPRRLLAVLVGFAGVLLMLWPQMRGGADSVGWIALLPLGAAASYAGMSVLTRKLGQFSRASALAIYLQAAFLIVSIGFYLVAGDGRFVGPDTSGPLTFLLRAWVWPASGDIVPMMGLGLLSAIIGYSMSQAYRIASAAVVAPFEYVLLIFALFWGYTIFGEWPVPEVLMGAAIIIAAGVYVFWRENRPGPAPRPRHRDRG